MIELNQYGSFGAKFSVIKTPSFNVRITTAKKHLFAGMSSVVWNDAGGFPPPAVAHATYASHLSKEQRHAAHDDLTEQLNSLGESGGTLRDAVRTAFSALQSAGTVQSFKIMMTTDSTSTDALGDALSRIVTGVFSQDREREMMTLRDNVGDSALQEQDTQTFLLHMRAAYLQLLGGAFAQAQGGPAAIMQNPNGSIELSQKLHRLIEAQPEFSEEMEAARDTYNTAYGSSPSSGIDAMSEQFANLVTGGCLSDSAKRDLTQHFVSVWQNWISQLSPLVPSGRETTAPRPGTWPGRGSGCLLRLLGLSWRLLAWLRSSCTRRRISRLL